MTTQKNGNRVYLDCRWRVERRQGLKHNVVNFTF
jgi:hypothetical protein